MKYQHSNGEMKNRSNQHGYYSRDLPNIFLVLRKLYKRKNLMRMKNNGKNGDGMNLVRLHLSYLRLVVIILLLYYFQLWCIF